MTSIKGLAAIVSFSAGLAIAADQPNHECLNATLWAQTAVEHDAVYLQAYRLAHLQLDKALKDKKWTAAVEQTGKFKKLPPAIIFDIDETVLDNSASQARAIFKNLDFSQELWAQWVAEAAAPPVPGAVEFTRYARSRGVTVFFITNRDVPMEEATRRNLEAAGFPLLAVGGPMLDTVLFRGEKPEWTGDKGTRRAAIAQNYRILMMFGDDLGDFLSNVRAGVEERRRLAAAHVDWFGTRWIALPNAMYGSWDGAVYNNDMRLTHDQKVAAKYGQLKTTGVVRQ